MKHRWRDKKTSSKAFTKEQCSQCGLIKRTYYDSVMFYRGDKHVLKKSNPFGNGTPKCDPENHSDEW